MSRLPTVAIIGRPNTGKSTLFNRLLGERRAIVSEVPGTTRDRVSVLIAGEKVDYLLIDTAGIGGGTEDKELEADVTAQTLLALESADVILFTVNAREEITAADHTVVEQLRKKRKRHVPIILVATKCDTERMADERIADLHGLGIGDDVVAVSAPHNTGIVELEEAIEKRLLGLHFQKSEKRPSEPVGDEDEETEGTVEESPTADTPEELRAPRIALIGKPNVGKSSIINAFLTDDQRAALGRIVSPIPGTTRDTSDTIIRHEGKEYIFVDTAGLRRKSRVEGDIERYSTLRSIKSLYDADIVALVLDGTEPVSQQDKRIARLSIEEGRGLVLIINKCDVLDTERRAEVLREVRRELQFCDFAPMMMVSAVDGENLRELFPLFLRIAENRLRRLSPKAVLRWYRDAVQRLPAQALSRGKFVLQAEDVPPTFVLFVPRPESVQRSQLKYLEHNLRSLFAFDGVPIRFVVKGK